MKLLPKTQNNIPKTPKANAHTIKSMSASVRYWAGYRLNPTVITTLLLILFVLMTIALGFLLYWGELVPDVGAAIFDDLKSFSIFDTVCSTIRNGHFGNAVLHGIQTIFDVLEGQGHELRAGFPNHPVLTWVICIAVPTLTVSTVILSLINFFPLHLPQKEEYLIFSQADENSIRLAESMMQEDNCKDRLVLFLRTEKDKLSPEPAGRMKKINAKVYPYTEADLLRIHWGLKNKRLRFFFLSSDTDLNFSRMKTLLKEAEDDTLFAEPADDACMEHKGVFQQELYLMSETESAPLLIDHLRKSLCETLRNDAADGSGTNDKTYIRKSVFCHTDVRLLDRYRTVTYDLLREEPLFKAADNKEIRVLVLGFGRVGKAFFRSAVSFCSMAGYNTSFCLCDQQLKKQWHNFLLDNPNCSDGGLVKPKFLNVESPKLLELLDEQIANDKPFTYIVLSLGDDERNIKVANQLVRHYRQKIWGTSPVHLPTICVNLENEIKSEYISEVYKGMTNVISPVVFGSDHKTFSETMLLNRGLWLAARKLHAKLKSNDFTYWSEYERRSSIACAAHAFYHVKSVTQKDDQYKALFEKLETTLVDAEHTRWMNYSRCEGMQAMSTEMAQKCQTNTGTHVDVVARATPCLVPTGNLAGVYKTLYPTPPAGMRSFYERDRFVVFNAHHLEQIIKNPHLDTELHEPPIQQQETQSEPASSDRPAACITEES